MQTWQKLTVVGVAIALWKSTSSMSPTDQVERIARAISRAEGWGVPGAIPTVRNNPGNIKNSGGVIITFQSEEEGWQALYRQVRAMLTDTSGLYNATDTIADTARRYTGEAAYMNWANNVAAFLGVSTDTLFRSV